MDKAKSIGPYSLSNLLYWQKSFYFLDLCWFDFRFFMNPLFKAKVMWFEKAMPTNPILGMDKLDRVSTVVLFPIQKASMLKYLVQ